VDMVCKMLRPRFYRKNMSKSGWDNSDSFRKRTDRANIEYVLREEPCSTDPYARFCGQTEAALASSDPI
jgi:hypothetical protein